MAKSRVAYVNLTTASVTTVTASTELSNRPASFLKSPARWKKWRSATSTADQNVVFDFGSALTVRVVAIVGWRRHSGGAIRADYWNGAAYVAFGTFTIPSANPTGLLSIWLPAGVSTSRIRIFFTNTGVVSDYVELGVCVAGDYYEPTFNVIDGFELRLIDPSQIVRAVGGEEEAQSRTTFHVLQGGYDYMGAADVAAWRLVLSTIGARAPFLFAADPADDTLNLYGRLVDGIALRQRATTNFDIPITVQELV